MEKFDYQLPIRIHFGQGRMEETLKTELDRYGKTVMLAFGGHALKATGLYDRLIKILKDAGKNVIDFEGIMPNPTYAKAQEGARIARENHVDLILAAGGGSVADCCKVISAQACLDKDIWDYEYEEHQLPQKFIPYGAIVTASGTGAEENNGAVITNEEKHLKSPLLGALAEFVILDPDLTKTVPQKQVISGAFDTLSHAMETYFGKPDELNVSDDINEAIQRNIIRNICLIVADPNNDTARTELMWDSAMAENGILKTGKITDFQCHMIEHQLGAYTNCNHGQGLAVLHTTYYKHVYKSALEKFTRWARNVWQENTAEEGIEALHSFIKEIGMPTSLHEMGITLDAETRKAIAETTIITAGCPKKLRPTEIEQILVEAE